MNKAKELYGHTCDVHHVVTEDEIKARAAEVERNAFIHANMAEYKRLFFPQPSQHKVMTDTLICDNGGFEDDFDFYYGFTTTFDNGSLSCNPKNGSTPSVYVPTVLPTLREFEIVSTGTDAITGLQKVKFGSKSLKLNDPYNHILGGCAGSYGVNKLVKRFLVTEDNRDVTVWYSIAIENPSSHNNTQPFFSITCDVAPLSDLCFDADILSCDSLYSQPGCGTGNLMDVLDWSCHRIKIPRTEIGQIATLEIVMGDCGQGGHNGYAYIDGICEDCVGSALGSFTLNELSVDYISCNGDIARVCGTYTDPFVCGEWYLDSIFINDPYYFSNEVIDTVNKTFCFDLDIANLGLNNSIEIYIGGLFKRNGGGSLPIQFSNDLEIDKWAYEAEYKVEAIVSKCHENNTTSNISDDYYFVSLSESGVTTESWDISRELDDPYDNESGVSSIGSGTGSFSLNLGPFLIQEGSWDLVINIGECTYIIPIDPPAYCSGCEDLLGVQISNVTCIEGTLNDTWTFDIFIPGSGNYLLNSMSKSYNTVHTINAGNVNMSCLLYTIEDVANDCEIEFTICPPKPCSGSEDCPLELTYDIECVSTSGSGYNITFDVTNIGASYLCVSKDGTPKAPYTNNSALLLSSGGDHYFTIFTCSDITCMLCRNEPCDKTIQIFQPDCQSGDYDGDKLNKPTSGLVSNLQFIDLVKIVPNPIDNNELRVISTLNQTSIEIINSVSALVHKSTFNGSEYKWNMTNMPSGIYFLKYVDNLGITRTKKFIKY